MTRAALLSAFAAALAACAAGNRPSPFAPGEVRKIAIRPFANRTQQFGLEDRLTLRVIDEFQRDGHFSVLPEKKADGVIVGTLTKYLLSPVQYDTTLAPTTYKLAITLSVRYVDQTKGTTAWEEKDMEEDFLYAAPTLPGGLTEAQAQADIWDLMATDVVKRVIEGYSDEKAAAAAVVPSTAPAQGAH